MTEALSRQLHELAAELSVSEAPLSQMLRAGRQARRRGRVRLGLAGMGVLATVVALAAVVATALPNRHAAPAVARLDEPIRHATDLGDFRKPVVAEGRRVDLGSGVSIGLAHQGGRPLLCWYGVLPAVQPLCPVLERLGSTMAEPPDVTPVDAKGAVAEKDPAQTVVTGTVGAGIDHVVVVDAVGTRTTASVGGRALGVGAYAVRLPGAAAAGTVVVEGDDAAGRAVASVRWQPPDARATMRSDALLHPGFTSSRTVTVAPGWTIVTGLQAPDAFAAPDPAAPVCLSSSDNGSGGQGCRAAPTRADDFGPDTPELETATSDGRTTVSLYGLVGGDIARVEAVANGERAGGSLVQAAGPACACGVYGIRLDGGVASVTLSAYDRAGRLRATWALTGG